MYEIPEKDSAKGNTRRQVLPHPVKEPLLGPAAANIVQATTPQARRRDHRVVLGKYAENTRPIKMLRKGLRTLPGPIRPEAGRRADRRAEVLPVPEADPRALRVPAAAEGLIKSKSYAKQYFYKCESDSLAGRYVGLQRLLHGTFASIRERYR